MHCDWFDVFMCGGVWVVKSDRVTQGGSMWVGVIIVYDIIVVYGSVCRVEDGVMSVCILCIGLWL